MRRLPSGTVTFLFSDIEGSTQLLERHGLAMGKALSRHHHLFEQVVERHDGAIFETVGDAVYAAFAQAHDAVAAALDAHRALAAEDWGPIGRLAVRIAIHGGAVERRGDHYFGPALFRCARLQVLGYGEQTLLSAVAAGLVAGALPAGASLRDLGRHRLKDLGEPEQVFQLLHPALRTDFPALKSLDAHPHNLPVQLSSFVGRDAELASLTELLDAHRLVTLTGPGGIGKTRLALQAAAERLERHPDGVFFVDLAALRDPSLVSATIASTLGLHEVPGDPITRTLQEYLASRRVLLVLDNLEHLLPAAAAVVAALLANAPQLHLAGTSRAPVRVRGEREYAVPPLGSGSPDQLDDTLPPAVALFIERARDVQPGLTIDGTTGPLIAEISARLDGLPLAIELAAARLRLFGLQALRERLARRLPLLTEGSRDLPKRQQTLRATIAWSEELLTPTQRRLFARLGVFVGGFSLEAVERVGMFGLEAVDLEDLSALVEHSLVRSVDDPLGAPRYTMLETIREYALERLEAGTESAAIRDRLAEHLVDMVEQAEPRLTTEEQTATLRQLDLELDNLRASLAWLRDRGDGQRLGRLAAGLARYCTHRGLLSEGRRWIAEARRLLPDADALLSAKLLRADGMLALELGELAEAATLLRQSADLYRARGDTGNLAQVLAGLANAEQSRGELNAATEAGIEARQLARAQGDTRTEASAVGNLAAVAVRAGRLEEAEAGIRRGCGAVQEDRRPSCGSHRPRKLGRGGPQAWQHGGGGSTVSGCTRCCPRTGCYRPRRLAPSRPRRLAHPRGGSWTPRPQNSPSGYRS